MTERSCVVTGASSGIGLATADALVADGWSVVGVARSEAPDLAFGASLGWVRGDVADRSTSVRAAESASASAPLLGWVNCAGIESETSAHDLDAEIAERIVATNLWGTMWGLAEATRIMVAGGRGGAIVNVGSVQSLVHTPASLVYAGTKGAMDAMARQVAVEYAAQGIRCNSVLPGAIDTPMNSRWFDAHPDPAAARAHEERLAPTGRLGTPAEVASAIRWLLSEEAAFVTGASLTVDGGATVRLASEAPAGPREGSA